MLATIVCVAQSLEKCQLASVVKEMDGKLDAAGKHSWTSLCLLIALFVDLGF